MRTIRSRLMKVTGILLSMLFMFSVPVHAGVNVPVDIEIPITYIVNGNVNTAGGDSFTLTPDDPNAPMPDGQVGGTKTIQIKQEGSYSFGTIHYDRPDVYWYTITRNVTKKKGVTKDTSVFRAKVIALNDGHGYVLVYKKDSTKKCELVYIDQVAPQTGEKNTLIYLGTGFISAILLLLLISSFRKEKKRKPKA